MDTPRDTEPKNALIIVEKYDDFVNYLYPMLINTSRQHRILRDTMLSAMLEQYRLFRDAGKSGQVSKLYIADAGLAYLRDLLRLMSDPARRLISRRQYEVASVRLAESGAILGAWIKTVQKRPHRD